MRSKNLISLCIAILLIVSASLSAATIEFITVPDSLMKFPVGINSDGSVIVGETNAEVASIWKMGEGAEKIGGKSANGIGDNGLISGTVTNADGKEEAAYYQDGEWHLIGNVPNGGTTGLTLSTTTHISSNGEFISGMGWRTDGVTEPFSFSIDSGLVGLGDYQGESGRANSISNDGSILAGWSRTPGTSRMPAYWVNGEIHFIDDLTYGDISRMTSDGSAFVGTSGNAFIWTEDGGAVSLGTVPGSLGSIGLDIADDMTTVGTIRDGMQPMFWRAMIKYHDGEISRITDYFKDNYDVPEGFENYKLLQANAISADGRTITGFGFDPDFNWVTWIIKVPVVNTGIVSGKVVLNNGNGKSSDVLISLNGVKVHPDETGYYECEILEGSYNVKADLFGYESGNIVNVIVSPGNTNSGNNFYLAAKEATINPPQELEIDGDTAIANWNAPAEGFIGNMSWDSGIYDGSIGINGGGIWAFSHYWDSQNLIQYAGGYINKVQFVPTSETTTYKLKIWSITNELLYEQEILNPKYNEWNTITLDEKFQINPLVPFYLGIEMDQPDGESPAAHDNGPVANGYGNMANLGVGGQWQALPASWNWNFNLNAIITDIDGKLFKTLPNTVKRERDYVGKKSEKDFILNSKGGKNRTTVKYNVYLNDMSTPIAQDVIDTTYTVTGLEEEHSYTIGVSAVYANGEESKIVTKKFTYCWESAHLDPMNLTISEETGLLNWELPKMWFHYDDGINFSGVGLEESDGTEFGIAARWDVKQLEDYANAKISKINFYPLSDSASYEIKIWNGDNLEDSLLYSQTIDSYTANEWNTVELNEKFVIKGTEEVWVGLWITNCPADSLVMGGSEGPTTVGYGNKIYLPAYLGWRNLSQFGFDYSWNIQALFEADDSGLAKFMTPKPIKDNEWFQGLIGAKNLNSSKAQKVTSFNVYLDGEKVASNITDMEYAFEGLTINQSYQAGIEAIYEDGDSDIITKDFVYSGTSIHDNLVFENKLSQNYPNPFNPATSISYQLRNSGYINLSIYNANGELVKTLVNGNHKAGHYSVSFDGSNLSSGIYYYSIKSNKFNANKKMILIK